MGLVHCLYAEKQKCDRDMKTVVCFLTIFSLPVVGQCPALSQTIANGNVAGGVNSVGDSVTYTCDVGHRISGKGNNVNTLTLVCGSNTTWNGSQPTCVRKWAA